MAWSTLGYSLIVQAATILSVIYLAWLLNVEITLGMSFTIFPIVLLISMLPVSVAGWGVREGAMAIGLGLLDVPHETSIAVSVLFGFVMLGSGLLGGALGSVGWRRLDEREAGDTRS